MAVDERVLTLLAQAKAIAREYRDLTGKPLGITGEVAEYEAARILDLDLSLARTPGFDATEQVDGVQRRLQIKGRSAPVHRQGVQQVGRIDLRHEFDAVLLVLLDPALDATAIWEAEREAVVVALSAPGSRARNERGVMSVSKFRSIGRLRWARDG